MKHIVLMAALTALTACAETTVENDPIFAALKANPPTEIPTEYLPALRGGGYVCDVYNKGRFNQYMTCWWPQDGLTPVTTAYLTYFPPNPILPPSSSQLIAPAGQLVVEGVPVN